MSITLVLFAMFWSTSQKFGGYHVNLTVQWWQKNLRQKWDIQKKHKGKMHCFRISTKLNELEYEIEEISSFIPGIVNLIVTTNEND